MAGARRGSAGVGRVGAAFLCLPAAGVWACPPCSASGTACLPGFNATGFHVALVLPILAAFIERAFFSMVRIDGPVLLRSVQANLLSALGVGVGGLFVMSISWSAPGGSWLMLAWLLAAVPLSAVIEYAWVAQRFDVSGQTSARFGWILVGNVVSALIIATLPVWRAAFGTDTYEHIRWVGRFREEVALFTVFGCLALYGVILGLSLRYRGRTAAGRGFEVICPAETASNG